MANSCCLVSTCPKVRIPFLWRRIVLDEYDDRQMESIPDHVLEVYII
jgi:hypothetical protein